MNLFSPQNDPLRCAEAVPQACVIAHPIVMVSAMLSWGHYLPPKAHLFSDVNSPPIFTQKSDTSVWCHKGGHICSKELHSGHYLSLITLHRFPLRELPLTHRRTSWWDCKSRFLAHPLRSGTGAELGPFDPLFLIYKSTDRRVGNEQSSRIEWFLLSDIPIYPLWPPPCLSFDPVSYH